MRTFKRQALHSNEVKMLLIPSRSALRSSDTYLLRGGGKGWVKEHGALTPRFPSMPTKKTAPCSRLIRFDGIEDRIETEHEPRESRYSRTHLASLPPPRNPFTHVAPPEGKKGEEVGPKEEGEGGADGGRQERRPVKILIGCGALLLLNGSMVNGQCALVNAHLSIGSRREGGKANEDAPPTTMAGLGQLECTYLRFRFSRLHEPVLVGLGWSGSVVPGAAIGLGQPCATPDFVTCADGAKSSRRIGVRGKADPYPVFEG